MADVSPMLPGIPAHLATCEDRARARVKKASQKRAREGFEQVAAYIHGSEVDYLMQVWQFTDKAQMVRIALRYLAQQTQCGLTEINLPGQMR